MSPVFLFFWGGFSPPVSCRWGWRRAWRLGGGFCTVNFAAFPSRVLRGLFGVRDHASVWLMMPQLIRGWANHHSTRMP